MGGKINMGNICRNLNQNNILTHKKNAIEACRLFNQIDNDRVNEQPWYLNAELTGEMRPRSSAMVMESTIDNIHKNFSTDSERSKALKNIIRKNLEQFHERRNY